MYNMDIYRKNTTVGTTVWVGYISNDKCTIVDIVYQGAIFTKYFKYMRRHNLRSPPPRVDWLDVSSRPDPEIAEA